jgi:uracil-DNA glycosylase family 4
MKGMSFSDLNRSIISCRKCPRLVAWREQVAHTKRKAYLDWEYWGKPVPGFGDYRARVLVVGLAPGAHGSNRTGRQFTGDASGAFLFPALYRAGFASQPEAVSQEDGMTLRDMYLTASARCTPPANKPTAEELDRCQPFLELEIELLDPEVIVVLGRIAFDRILRIYSSRRRVGKFAHGAVYRLADGPWLVCSYHPSRQNTQTGKLTDEMFAAVWERVKSLVERV